MRFNRLYSRIMILGLFGFLISISNIKPLSAQQIINAEITSAPNVPAPIKRTTPARVVVNLEAKEFVGTLAQDTKYTFWSFNGTVPGPMIRVRVGDTVEFHLSNHKDNAFAHNIDLHAVNGPGGGAAVSLVDPGDKAVFEFKVLNPGLYIYHCAASDPSIPAHISNGMYGTILVEPKKGMSMVDKEFYVMQSEFFTEPSDKEGILKLSMKKGLAENPDYVVFNGSTNGLMGDKALKAKVGDNIRIYFGNIGPNSASSFHIIGEIFDKVYVEGALDGLINKNIQTTLVPSAGATIVEFKVDVPATYLLVDHSIFRVAKGAAGALIVSGPENPSVFKKITGSDESKGH
ncbi:MAG: copper-containing nitrite reductase [Nitrospirota bacterium]